MALGILNVNQRAYSDESITKFEYHSYMPYINTTFNNSDEIRIPIQAQDIYTLPCESLLCIEGKIVDDKGKHSDKIKLLNNCAAYLFDEMRYEIAGCTVDKVKNVGTTSRMKNLCSFKSPDATRYAAAGMDVESAYIRDANGNFNFVIPMKLLMGFFEDFRKILINMKQELILIRSSTDNNFCYYSPVAGEVPQLTINKIVWKIPHVQISDIEKLRLLKQIEKSQDLEIGFRAWDLYEYPMLPQTTKHIWPVKTTNQLEKPRFILIGFQINRKNVLSSYSNQFDTCHITNLKVFLNSESYPYDNLNLDFKTNKYAILYEMYANFRRSYYYTNDSDAYLTPQIFKDKLCIFVIDTSHQNESLKSGGVDVRIEFEASENLAAKTTCYCLILHDKLVRYNPLNNIVKVM
nr:TPA_asm: hexon [Bos-associated insect adintovirus 2]